MDDRYSLLECDGMSEQDINDWSIQVWIAAVKDILRKDFFYDFFQNISSQSNYEVN